MHSFIGILVALTSVALSQKLTNKPVCNDWVEPFFEMMTLNEDRPASVNDLKRIFTIMDINGDDLVSEPEFQPPWRMFTTMGVPDTKTLFAYWAIQKDTSDPLHISSKNIDGVWDYFDRDGNNSVDRTTFIKVWTEEFLPSLPNDGCRDN